MKRYLYIYGLILSVLVSCNDRGLDAFTSDENAKVYLSARVVSNVMTKTPYIPVEDDDTDFDAPTSDNPLNADVWASWTSGIFKNKGLAGSELNPEVSFHTWASFQNYGPQLLHDIIYSKSGNSLYFVAFAPRDSWQSVDVPENYVSGNEPADAGRYALATFDGTIDLMYAPQVEGKYGNKVNDVLVWPELKFHHLLTWLRFEFVAENEDASLTWGRIKDIKIVSRNQIKIDLSEEFDPDAPGSSVTFIGDSDSVMPLYSTGTDNIFPYGMYEIPYKAAEEKAYVLCEAVEAYGLVAGQRVPEYILRITTENRQVNVPVDLRVAADSYYEGTTRARQFTIKLTFKVGDKITAAASIMDWENGGIIEGVVDEN